MTLIEYDAKMTPKKQKERKRKKSKEKRKGRSKAEDKEIEVAVQDIMANQEEQEEYLEDEEDGESYTAEYVDLFKSWRDKVVGLVK